MRLHRSTALSIAALASLVAATLVPSTASAGVPSDLVGVVTCDNATGEQVITWTFTNNTQFDATLNAATVDASGLIAGSVTSTSVTMSPNPTASLGSSSGQTVATNDASGTVAFTLNWTVDQSTVDSTALVLLTAACAIPATTTTTTVVDTTAVDTTAVATTTTIIVGNAGGGGGTIPTTGSDLTLLWVGAGLIAAGGVLLATRRRATSDY